MDPALAPASGVITFKILVSNDQAGAIIGKSGAQITALQESKNVFVKLGGPEDLFPGTFYRAAIIRGEVPCVKNAVAEVVDILWKDYSLRRDVLSEAGRTTTGSFGGEAGNDLIRSSASHISEITNGFDSPGHKSESELPAEPSQAAHDFVIRLLVPDNSSGAVIGKGGKTVRAIAEHTGAHVKLSSNDTKFAGVAERAVLVSGAYTSVRAAVLKVFEIMCSEARNLVYANPTVHYARQQFSVAPADGGYYSMPYSSWQHPSPSHAHRGLVSNMPRGPPPGPPPGMPGMHSPSRGGPSHRMAPPTHAYEHPGDRKYAPAYRGGYDGYAGYAYMPVYGMPAVPERYMAADHGLSSGRSYGDVRGGYSMPYGYEMDARYGAFPDAMPIPAAPLSPGMSTSNGSVGFSAPGSRRQSVLGAPEAADFAIAQAVETEDRASGAMSYPRDKVVLGKSLTSSNPSIGSRLEPVFERTEYPVGSDLVASSPAPSLQPLAPTTRKHPSLVRGASDSALIRPQDAYGSSIVQDSPVVHDYGTKPGPGAAPQSSRSRGPMYGIPPSVYSS